MFLPVCWSEEGFNAALPSGQDARRVFGRFWVLFQTLFFFRANYLGCACCCCFCSARVCSLSFHLNSCPGTSVSGWCPCFRAEAVGLLAVCWLRFPRVTVCPELTTEVNRQSAVNNLKCISIFVFFGSPTFAERVQQQADILPWPGLCLLFPVETNNEV